MPPTATSGHPTSIDPTRLYSLAGFIADSGIAYERISQAKKDGIPFPGFRVGRRLFIKGVDAIKYIELLAAQSAADEEEQP